MKATPETQKAAVHMARVEQRIRKLRWLTIVVAGMLLYLAGCGTSVQVTGGEGSPDTGPKITREQAVDIAKKRLADEPFSAMIDSAKITVKYCPQYGPRKAPFACWLVDFAKVGSAQVETGSGLWEAGYHVLIDPDTGNVKEATRYMR